MRLEPGPFAFLIFAAVAGCSGERRSLPSRDFMTSTVQADVEALAQALYSGNLEAVVDHTHPAIVKGLGGRAKALSAIEDAIGPILERGIRVESLSFPKPPDFIETDREVFAIVPTLMVMELAGERVESLNYQFGVLDPDAVEWMYVEGSRINAGNVRSLFPSFPSDYEFPESYRRKM